MITKYKINNFDVEQLKNKNLVNGFSHSSHKDDMLQYEFLKDGNLASVEASNKMFQAAKQGCLSDDPIRNLKYLFVANTTLASRFAVEAGLDIETAYAISDLYIQKMDHLYTVEEIATLRQEMFTHYTNQVALTKKKKVYSRPVLKCMQYIKTHISESLNLSGLSDYVSLNSNYLSTLFRRETEQTISSFIRYTRIEYAKSMLRQSDMNYSDISVALGFSSQSHFTKVFHEETGYTPKKYRNLFFDQSISIQN